MSWLGGWLDPELQDLFRNEPELLETAQRVRAARPQAEPDPRFQNRLRAQLIAEASRGADGARRWWRLGPTHAAWGGAVLGAALIGATVLTFLSSHPQDRTITAMSPITAQRAVDPNNVIQVSFNQPMNKTAVEQGVRIQPATVVSYSWSGNNLVITPAHHLTGNTPYTVTIAPKYIRAATGAVSTTPISITFATRPTPPVGRSTPPALDLSTIGPEGTGADDLGGALLFAPDGSLVSTAGLLAAAPSTPPTAPASPGASPTATPEGGQDTGPSVAGQLVDYPSNGVPFALAAAASAAAFSPNGTYVAAAVDDGNGGSKLLVTLGDGSQRGPTKLIDSSTPVTALTWASNDRIVYTDGTTISEVDLSGKVTSLYSVPDSAGTVAELDPRGAYAYVAPASGTGGNLVDIATGVAVVLQGSTTEVGFSGDGGTVIWADASTSESRVWTESVTQQAPASMSLLDPTATYGDIAVDMDGDEVAYLMTAPSKGTQIVVAEVPSGTPLAIDSVSFAPSDLALSGGGDQVALLGTDSSGVPSVEQASVPGSTAAHVAPGIPAAANSTLHAFVEAQVGGDLATLSALSGPNTNAAAKTPQNLSRAYVISTYVMPHGVVSANVELVVDPNAGRASTEVASETLTLTSESSSSTYVVSRVVSTSLHNEASGPHVVQVNATTQAGHTTLVVSFDSDLKPASVGGAVTVLDANGTTLTSSTVYDADTRTATVTIANAPSGALTLVIATSLDDVYGQALAHAFQTEVGSNSS